MSGFCAWKPGGMKHGLFFPKLRIICSTPINSMSTVSGSPRILAQQGLIRRTRLLSIHRPTHFRAILMNVKPLLKYFPEIHHLPQDVQLRLLQSAHDEVFGPHNKLRIWRSNLAGFAVLIVACTLVIAVIGPWLDMQASTTGVLLMLIVFPVFLWVQQRRYLARLRPIVDQLARQHRIKQA